MTTVAHSSELRRPGRRRPRRTPSSDPLGVAPVPPRVAPADPGDRSAHGCGHGRGHQRHDRLQLGPPRLCGVRLGERPVRVGRRRSAQAGGKSRRRRGTVRDDRRHRPPHAARAGQCRDGGVPGPGPARTVRRACAPPRQLPGRPRPGRRHRRSRDAPRARNREDSRPRRPSPNRRRHRREPT